MSLSVVVDGVGWGRTRAFVCLITPPASSSSSTAAVSSLLLPPVLVPLVLVPLPPLLQSCGMVVVGEER